MPIRKVKGGYKWGEERKDLQNKEASVKTSESNIRKRLERKEKEVKHLNL